MSGPAGHTKENCPYNRHECDGDMTLGPDPFAEEIHNDSTYLWMCKGARYESAMDI